MYQITEKGLALKYS